MKKVVRMLGLCALVALAFTSCKKDQTESVTFKATMPTVNNATRTHVEGAVDSYWLEWNNNDAIKVIDENKDDKIFPLTTNNGATAEFHVVGTERCEFVENLVNAAAPYAAFYPNAAYTKGVDEVVLEIPANQTIAGGFRFANLTYPMVGTNTTDEGLIDNFLFDSPAGFLYLNFGVQENTTVTINKIVLTSAGTNDLAGNLIYNPAGTSYTFEGTSNVITATWPAPVVVNQYQPADATIILPEGALTGEFDVEVYNGDELIATYHANAHTENTIVAKTYTMMANMLLN